MKNMKTTFFLKGVLRPFLVIAALTLGCMSALSQITNVRPIVAWNGSCTGPNLIGDYYQFSLDGFNGEIVLETADFVNAGSKPADSQFELWTLKDDANPEKAVKIQIKSGYTGFLCVSYNEETNSVDAAYGSCSGTIAVSSKMTCKGSSVTFSVENGDAGASKRWGLLAEGASMKDADWLTEYENMDQFDYVVNDSIKMVLKYTTTSGLVSYSMIPVFISLDACGEKVTSDKSEICPGEEVTFTSTYKDGKVYEWRRSSGAVVAVTNEPTLTFRPNTSLYYLYVDGLFAGSVSVKLNGCGFFITPLYPITTCLQDSNYLYAVGDEMVSDIKNPVFEWETSLDGETWTTIEGQKSYKLSVYPTEDTYYRAKYKNEYTAAFLYELPNCEENELCEGLQTRVLFYETFGFFVNENTYVSDKDAFVNDMSIPGGVEARSNGGSLGFAGNYSNSNDSEDYIDKILGHETDGSAYYSARRDNGYDLYTTSLGTTSYHIQKFVAPDPNGHVVPASEFVRVNEDGKESKSNQFVGTDGHLFLQANPMLPLYAGWGDGKDIDNNAFRLQDGYYAIVANPDSVDRHLHQDYADIPDATGNVNGAMLMVNSGQTNVSKSAIYAQRVVLGCAADRFAFSMNVRNVTKQDGKNPVNVSVLLLEDIGETLPAEYKTMGGIQTNHILNDEINSGDLPSGSSAEWKKVERYVDLGSSSKVKSLWVVLYNNGVTGNGNDMVIDDISFSVCLPKAELVAKVDGEDISGSLTVCDGRDVELYATQKGNYIPDPVYLFQYFDNDKKEWLDMMDYSDEAVYKKTKTIVSVTDPRFVGDVDYRVIIAAGIDELRDVASSPDDICNEFLVARSNIDIRNTFGGPMGPDTVENVCFVVGDTVTVKGYRNLSREDHTWKMYWTNEKKELLVDTLEVTGVSMDSINFVIDKNYNVRVFDRNWNKSSATDSVGMSKIFFVAIDEGGCEHVQSFDLLAKHVVKLSFDGTIAIGCDSVIVSINKDVPEAQLIWDWGMPGREVIINDTARAFIPEGIDKTGSILGTLRIFVNNDGDKFCAPADPLTIPYKVNNVSYKLSVDASKNPVCVTPGQADETILLTLTPVVEPKSAKDNIRIYNWRLDFGNGDVVDTFTNYKDPKLKLNYLFLKNRTGKSVKAQLISTETAECGVVINLDANSGDSIDIREGQFYLTLEALNPQVCLTSTDTIYLKGSISPATALTNISYFKLNDLKDSISFIPTNVTDSVYYVALDKAHYGSYFVPGTIKQFTISTYDQYCKANNISSEARVDLNGYKFTLADPEGDGKECVSLGQKMTVTATLDDPNAAKLIKSYKWYKDGEFLGGSGLSYNFVITESSNSYYKLEIDDGICPPQPDSVQIATSVNYEVSLTSSKLTTCQYDDSATARAIITPASSMLQIKEFEWHAVVNGTDIVILNGTQADSVILISSTNFPDLVKAGVNADIYVIAKDSICPDTRSEGNLSFRFNVPYTMKVNYDGTSICVPSDKDIDPSFVLLKVDVDVDPVEALGQIKSYIWHYKSKDESVWKVKTTGINQNYLELTYSDLSGYRGKDVQLYVSSFDDVCSLGENPAISDTVNLLIRVGGFDIDLADIPTSYCVESLDDAKFTLKAVLDKPEAINNIKEFYWYDNGKLFATTKEDSIVLDKNTYKDVFAAGYTANFSVAAYDSACELDTVRSNNSTKVEFNTHFALSLSYPSDKICLPADDKFVTLEAVTDPSDARKLIKRYVWERISPSEKTTTTNNYSLNLSDVDWLEVSDNMRVKVTAYDDVCYNEASGGSEFMDTLLINKKFTPTLSLDNQYICSEGGSISSKLTIDPADAYVHDYKFKYTYKGKVYNIDVDSIDLFKPLFVSDYFLDDMESGDVLSLFVEIDDSNVCGPIESDQINVSIQNPYTLSISTDNDKYCINSDISVSVNKIDPSSSENFIKSIKWYDNGSKVDAKDVQKVYTSSEFALGSHELYAVSSDDICPSVQSNTVKFEVLDSIRLKFTPLTKYTYCEKVDQDVSLQVQALTGHPVKYELYSYKTNELLTSLEYETMSYIVEGYNPTVDDNTYYVRVYDGVCSYDKYTAATASLSIQVHVPVEMKVEIQNNSKDVCIGDSIKLALIPIAGFPSYYSVYGKSDELIQKIVPRSDTTYIYDIAKESGYLNYTVVAIDEICPSSSESDGSIFVHESPQIQLYANKENVIIGGDIVLYADAIKGSPTTFEWFCDGESFAVTSSNTTTYLPQSTSEYLVLASDGVCPSATSSLTLDVHLPTAFTPYLLDGLNDTFMRGFRLEIFDRYGQKVFEGEDGWTAQKGNSSKLVDPGLYFYKVVMKNGKVEKGSVEVVYEK